MLVDQDHSGRGIRQRTIWEERREMKRRNKGGEEWELGGKRERKREEKVGGEVVGREREKRKGNIKDKKGRQFLNPVPIAAVQLTSDPIAGLSEDQKEPET